MLSAIYEQDFLDCSFGGRPGRGAHNALATLNEIISGKKVSWVFEADLKNYFGSLHQGWLLKFVEHRVGDPRILNLIRRWLKAGVIEDGKYEISETGTPQGCLCKASHKLPYAKKVTMQSSHCYAFKLSHSFLLFFA